MASLNQMGIKLMMVFRPLYVIFLAIPRYLLAELVSNTFLFAIEYPRANTKSSLGPRNLLMSIQTSRNMSIERSRCLAVMGF